MTDMIYNYFRVILSKMMITKNIEKINPKTATNDSSPILGPASETKTIDVAIILAPKTIAKMRLTILDLIN